MFKLLTHSALLVAAMMISLVSQAQNIAVVNIQAAILESSYGKSELAKLEEDADYAALVTEAQTLIADVQALDKDAQSNGSNWSQDQLNDYNKQRQFLTADIQLNQQKIQAEREQVVRQINAAMNQPALEALQALVEEEGISLLLKENSVYHATDAHNVTSKLAAKLSK